MDFGNVFGYWTIRATVGTACCNGKSHVGHGCFPRQAKRVKKPRETLIDIERDFPANVCTSYTCILTNLFIQHEPYQINNIIDSRYCTP